MGTEDTPHTKKWNRADCYPLPYKYQLPQIEYFFQDEPKLSTALPENRDVPELQQTLHLLDRFQ